jgi:hypothetical protein
MFELVGAALSAVRGRYAELAQEVLDAAAASKGRFLETASAVYWGPMAQAGAAAAREWPDEFWGRRLGRSPQGREEMTT